MMTVLLTAAAATIGLLLAQQTVAEVNTARTQRTATEGFRAARDAIAVIETELAADPAAYLTRVLPGERTRTCLTVPTGPVTANPGDPWPTECGPVWAYLDPVDPHQIQLTIQPPSAASPDLVITAVSNNGPIDVGYQTVFHTAPTGNWVLRTSRPLDLTTVTGTVNLHGSVYAAGPITYPSAAETAAGATHLSETGTTGTEPVDVTVIAAPSPQRRRVHPPVITDAAISAASYHTHRAACLPTGPAPLTTGTPATLCFQAGLPVSGPAAGPDVPAGTAAYLLIPKPDGLHVWATNTRIDTTPTSPYLCHPQPGCTLAATAATMIPAGTHPGAQQFWDSPTTDTTYLGVFNYPASGIVWFSHTTLIGACSNHGLQYPTQTGCDAHDTVTPGATFTQPITVAAGTPTADADIILGAPIGGTPPPTMLAAGQIIVPYWALADPAGTTFTGHLIATGGYHNQPAVTTFPAHLDLTGPGDPDQTARITIGGSITGPVDHLGFPLAATTTYQPDPTGPIRSPHAPVGGWQRALTRPVTGPDLCDEARCDHWQPLTP